MKMISTSFALVTFSTILSITSYACGPLPSLEELARRAISPDPVVATAAIASLRASGQAGLDALFKVHAQPIALATSPSALRFHTQTNGDWLRIKAALEAVAQQRDCEAAKLFWFTDFDQAKAAAEATGKPILSLRLLGKLNEEYSCANSRFFRTTLYANASVSSYLRDHFILHWKSVRPVPRITVDFGDGRKIERTITGNSIHYILDCKGRVVDALPGLYGAKAFLAGLQKAEAIARTSATVEDAGRDSILREYHNLGQQTAELAWAQDLRLIRGDGNPVALSAPTRPAVPLAGTPPTAQVAARVTMSKTAIERPLLKSTRPGAAAEPNQLRADAEDANWTKIAALHAEEATLDQTSRALIRSKAPNAARAALVTEGKRLVEDPLLRSLRNLERSISEDTLRNEYLLHTKIHQWLAEQPSGDLDKLNARIYAELFLTPDSDPWLGLVPADTYSALDNDGLVTQVHN